MKFQRLKKRGEGGGASRKSPQKQQGTRRLAQTVKRQSLDEQQADHAFHRCLHTHTHIYSAAMPFVASARLCTFTPQPPVINKRVRKQGRCEVTGWMHPAEKAARRRRAEWRHVSHGRLNTYCDDPERDGNVTPALRSLFLHPPSPCSSIAATPLRAQSASGKPCAHNRK